MMSRWRRYFEMHRLKVAEQRVAKPFCDIAMDLIDRQSESTDLHELEFCLRQLLSAKDAALRAYSN